MKTRMLLLILLAQLFAIGINMTNQVAAQDVPTLQVKPQYRTQSVSYINETFSIDVTIADVNATAKLIEAEFRLSYNNTVLEVVNVTEGSFLTDPRWNWYGTFWVYYAEDDPLYGPHVLVGEMIYPNTTNGEFDQTQFPEGNGTIATITFKVIQGPPNSCSFELIDTMCLNTYRNEVPHNFQDGHYGIAVETLYHEVIWEEQSYTVSTESNVTVNPVPLCFSQLHKALHFNVTGPEGTVGYCNITIPKELLYALPAEWLVLVGGQSVDYQVSENATHTSLYFACPMSTKPVYIMGTAVIPEFPTAIIPMIFVTLTIFITALAKFTQLKRRETYQAKPTNSYHQ